MKHIIYYSFFLSFSISLTLHSDTEKPATGKRVIVCDLITKQHTLKASEIANANILHYVPSRFWAGMAVLGYGARSIISLTDPTKLQHQLFDELRTAHVSTPDPVNTAYYQGDELPPLFCAYLASQLTGQETLQQAITHLDTRTSREKNLFKAATELFVTPEQIVQTLSPAPTLIALLKKIKEQNADMPIILAANFSSSAVLKSASPFQALFNYLSGSVCSGDIRTLKTSVDFYARLCERFPNITPQEAIFIETDERHATAVRRAAFTAITWNGTDMPTIQSQLAQYGIIT